NEIEVYRSVRYISSSEAMWHMFGFCTSQRFPSVNLLCVHHEGEQTVIHDEADEPEKRQGAADSAISDLMRYFGRPVHARCSNLTYPEYYEQFSVAKDKRTRKRTRTSQEDSDGSVDDRLQYMSPDQGDIWFLRLLSLKRAAYNFSELKSINNVHYESYEKCARELGLVHNVDEYTNYLQEVIEFSTARELRRLFTTLILHGAPAAHLWE
ncbi:unnamed protein product, partial [Ectocarpus sp. 12 AP-2014]